MNWGIGDAIAAAVLIAAAWIGIALVRRNVPAGARRVALTVIVIAAMLAIWAHLAVGMF